MMHFFFLMVLVSTYQMSPFFNKFWYVTGYTKTNIGPSWMRTRLNIFPRTIQSNKVLIFSRFKVGFSLDFYYIYIFFFISAHWSNEMRVCQWPGRPWFNPGWVIPQTQKMVHDTSLLNTQHYKVCIKGKVEQSKERSSTLSYTLV